HQISLEEHIPEHGHEKGQKAIPEPPGSQEPGRRFIPGAAPVSSQLLEQLAPAAIPVAEALVSPKSRQDQGEQEVYHSQPGKQDIKKSQGKVNDGPDPEILIPMLFLLFHPSS